MTPEELRAKARELAAAGNIEAAKRALAMAKSKDSAPEDIQPNPDGTYGSPPEGFVMNPRTGQMTSRELMSNNMDPGTAKSAAVGAHQGLSFGFGDEAQGALNAAIPGPGTASERYAYGREYMRALEDAARKGHPGATTAGEVGGALATAMMPVGLGGQAARIPGAARVSQLAAWAPRTSRALASGAEGAAMAGAYGFGAGEGGVGQRAEDARNAAMLGGALGVAIPVAGAGIQKGLQARATRKAIKAAAKAGKSTSELFDEGSDLYGRIADAGVEVKPTSAIRGYGDVAIGLANQGADELYPAGVPHPTPSAAAAFQLARTSAEKAAKKPSIPFRDIDVKSRTFRNIAGSNPQNRADARLAQMAKEKFDNYVLGLTPDDVSAGDVETLTSVLPKAREVWSRARKSQLVEDATEKGANYLSGGASGIKNRFKSILNKDALAKQFTPGEQAAMRRVIDGTFPEKMLDMFGSGLGQMATTAAGGVAGSGLGGLGALGGMGAGAAAGHLGRRASEALARRNAEIARAAISSGKLGNLPVADQSKRAIIEALLRGTVTPMAGR